MSLVEVKDEADKWKDQIGELQEVFTLFDKEGEGYSQAITKEKLAAVMQSMGYAPTDVELTDIVDAVSTNSSGSINFSDFLKMMTDKADEEAEETELKAPAPKPEEPMTLTTIAEVFKDFDKARTGFISYDELKEMLLKYNDKLSDEDIFGVMKLVDPQLGPEGNISYEKFFNVMRSSVT